MSEDRDKERRQQVRRQRYHTDPEYRARILASNRASRQRRGPRPRTKASPAQLERNRLRMREYRKRPEVRAQKKAYQAEYSKRPEARARKKAYQAEYHKRPEVRERHRGIGYTKGSGNTMTDELLTVQEVAQIMHLDPSTIRRMIQHGKIPAVPLPHTGKRTVYRIKRECIQGTIIEGLSWETRYGRPSIPQPPLPYDDFTYCWYHSPIDGQLLPVTDSSRYRDFQQFIFSYMPSSDLTELQDLDYRETLDRWYAVDMLLSCKIELPLYHSLDQARESEERKTARTVRNRL